MRAFAPKADMRIYDRGIRRRLAPMLRGDRRHIELAYSLQFTMPGTPVLRYGEEIGMGEDLSLAGRDSIRTPMQWEATTAGGFSAAKPAELVRPMPTRGRFSNRNVNVRQQRTDPSSLLRWFGQLINEVRECPEISVGTITVLDLPLPRSVMVHRYDAPEGSILLMHNLADRAVTIDLSAVEGTKAAYTVFGDADYGPLASVVEAAAHQRMGVPLAQAASRRLAGGCGPPCVRAVPVGELPHQGTRRLECPQHLVGRRVLGGQVVKVHRLVVLRDDRSDDVGPRERSARGRRNDPGR